MSETPSCCSWTNDGLFTDSLLYVMPDAKAAGPRSSRTIVLAAYLTSAKIAHVGQGSFAGANSTSGLLTELDNFIGMSPGLCRDGVQVHVVHDLPHGPPSLVTHRGIILHRYAPDPSYLGGDRRWVLYRDVLQALARAGTVWHCAWALDLDVAVFVIPTCAFLPRQLHVGSDACSGKLKGWMTRISTRTRLNETWDANYRAFLGDKRPIANSGIVGGRRSVFNAALHALTHRLEMHRQAAPQARNVVGADMLLVNWLVLERMHNASDSSSRSGVASGFPFGPVNWPMWARLPVVASHSLCPSQSASGDWRSHRKQPPCNAQCAYEWLNATLVGGGTSSSYWFGHKLPRSWLNRIRLHQCYPEVSADGRVAHALLYHTGSAKFRCECREVGHGPPKGSSIRSLHLLNPAIE